MGARKAADVCVLGDDLSRGQGYVADAQLLDTGSGGTGGQLAAPLLALDAKDPSRATSSTLSHERLVPILMTAMAAGLALIPLAVRLGGEKTTRDTAEAIADVAARWP